MRQSPRSAMDKGPTMQCRLMSRSAPDDEAPKDIFGTVPLAKRVGNWIEKTDAGMELDILSAVLSIVTVITYMIETYYPEDSPMYQRLKALDVVLSVLFAIEWAFWCWLSRDKVHYVFSIQSLVDIVTVVPIFISYFISEKVPGFATFEAMIRILRVLRVFRVFRLGRRLRSEVQARLLTLIFTLLAIIVTSAGLFYEIETRYGDRYPDLKMSQAIYWSVVTTTTIGYGDISPSLIGSQVTLIAMLFITFAILPYQTSALASAFSYTSVYTTAHYSRRARGRHVVITGHLTVATMALLVEELYHEDYGFQDFNCVFLAPENPDDEMRRLLKTHKQSHRMLYLQGSPMSHEDLTRAQVDKSDAILIMCNKTPTDAKEEDLRNVMACLAAGQYIQMVTKASDKQSIPTLSQRLLQLFVACLAKLSKGNNHPTAMPFMCIQLLLPESQQRLNHLLETYAMNQGCVMYPAASCHASSPPTNTKGAPPPGLAQSVDQVQAAANNACTKRQSQPELCDTRMQPQSASVSRYNLFWQEFRYSLTVICVTEIRYSLLGHSLLSCPGAVTLLCNLVRSVDAASMLESELEQLPLWFQEYLDGSGNELYEVASFPQHMVGEPLAAIAMFLQETHRAVIVAASGSAPMGQPCTSRRATKAATVTAGDSPIDAAQGSQQPCDDNQQHESASGAASHLDIPSNSVSVNAPIVLAPLHHVVTASTSAFVIASDLRVVLDIMEGSEEEYREWKLRQPGLQAGCWSAKQLPHRPKQQHTLHDLQEHELMVTAGIKQAAALDGATLFSDYVTGSIVEQHQQLQKCSTAASSVQDEDDNRPLSTPLQRLQLQQAAAAAAIGQPVSPIQQPSRRCSRNTLSGTPAAAEAADPPPDLQRRRTAESLLANSGGSVDGSNWAAMGVAGLFGTSAKSLIGALPNPLAGIGGTQDGSLHAKRRPRASIQVNTRPGAAGLRRFQDVVAAASQAPASRRHLSAASRRGKAFASGQFQQLYHTRQPTDAGSSLVEVMMQDEVDLQGHLVVCASSTPPSALFCLLAPLRSSALSAVQPVVILDTGCPTGSEWDKIASFAEVYYVQGTVHDSDALNKAHAEAAASAVLLLPWGGHGSSPSQQDNSPEMVDAYVLAATRSLKGLNANMQVFCELNLSQSLAFLDPFGSWLDWRSGTAAAAAATPAYMSGTVLSPVMVDTMVCQAMYNHGTARIIAQLLTQWHSQTGSHMFTAVGNLATASAGQWLLAQRSPGGTAGRQGGNSTTWQGGTAVQAARSDDAIAKPSDSADTVTSATRNDSGQVGSLLLPAEWSTAGVNTNHGILAADAGAMLSQIPVADCLCDTFGELFSWLVMDQGVICCGLYRSAVHEGREMWYVVTNPDKNLPLRDSDKAFVLVPHVTSRAAVTLRNY